MALEKFIRGKIDSVHHAGLRSTRRRLEDSIARFKDWENERIAAHEQGHFIDSIPQDEEIVLFDLSSKSATID